jgi:hypothetical protein
MFTVVTYIYSNTTSGSSGSSDGLLHGLRKKNSVIELDLQLLHANSSDVVNKIPNTVLVIASTCSRVSILLYKHHTLLNGIGKKRIGECCSTQRVRIIVC